MARNSLKNVCRLIEQAKDELSPEQSFLIDLKRSIEEDSRKGARKPSQTYKPSSMNCIRNMYYQVIGAEPDVGDESYCMIGICNSGSDIHIRIQSAVEKMKDNGMDCEYVDVAQFIKSRKSDEKLDDLVIREKYGAETKLYHKGLNMSFMCDGIIRYKGHYYILEIKTEMGMKWNKRDAVDPKHYAQGTAYSIAFNLPDIMFLYISRDLLDMKTYIFTPTDDMKNELVNKIMTCDNYVKQQQTPPKPDDLPKRTCEYCGYKTVCKGDI